MVIGERFAWAHLPKTGGDATALMLDAVPGLVTFGDPASSNDKHLPLFAREAEIEGRVLVMNIRRLPAWALSGAQHRARHGTHPDYTPVPLESPEAISQQTDADDLLRWMTDHGRFRVDRWLRCEHLTNDVLALLQDLGALTPDARAAVAAVGAVNAGAYDHDLAHWFTEEQCAHLYEFNPRWASIEQSVYGDRLRLSHR